MNKQSGIIIRFSFRSHNSWSNMQKILERVINGHKEIKLDERFSYQEGR